MLGMYKESDSMASKAPSSPLINRLQFHLAHKVSRFLKSTDHYAKAFMRFNAQFKSLVLRVLCISLIYYSSLVMRNV